MVLLYSVYLVLGVAALARAVALPTLLVPLRVRYYCAVKRSFAAGFGSVDTSITFGVSACVCRLLFRAMIWNCLTHVTEVRGFAR
jgi:hypothetical protein